MTRAARKAGLISLLGVVLMAAGSTAQAGWLFVLAAGAFGLIAGSFLLPRRPSDLRMRREVPDRVRVGDAARVVLGLHNSGSHALPILRLEDVFEAFEPGAVIVEPLGVGESTAVELVKTATRRGIYETGQATVVTGAPFGIRDSRAVLDVASRSIVVPRWVELRSFPILEPSSFPHETLHYRARTGAGEEYLGVREYRAGDPIRNVHWKTSARANRLVVREFEEEAASRVAVVVAGLDAGEPPDSSFEAIVTAAASIARYSLVTGHPVDLVHVNEDGTWERAGDLDPVSVLDRLAAVRPADHDMRILAEAALARVQRRGTVVLLAPASGTAGRTFADAVATVQAGGSRAIVVVAKPSSWGDADRGGRDSEESRIIQSLEAGRSVVRVLTAGRELRRCLEA